MMTFVPRFRKVAAAALLASSLILASDAFALPWTLDTAHSRVGFSIRHLMISNVHGFFGKFEGAAEYDGKDITTATLEVKIDPASVNTVNEKRDDHLRTPDFFDVAKFKDMGFVATKFEAAGEGKSKVTGDFTMHGVTKSLTLDVEGPTPVLKGQKGSLHFGVSATAKISRKDFGLTYGKLLETGGAALGDEVTITIDAEFVHKSEEMKADEKKFDEKKPETK